MVNEFSCPRDLVSLFVRQTYGPTLVNPARCNPIYFGDKLYKESATSGSAQQTIQMTQAFLNNLQPSQPTVLCTFGSVTESHIATPSATNDDRVYKNIAIYPLMLEWERTIAFITAVLGEEVMEVRLSRDQSLVFSTRVAKINNNIKASSKCHPDAYGPLLTSSQLLPLSPPFIRVLVIALVLAARPTSSTILPP